MRIAWLPSAQHLEADLSQELNRAFERAFGELLQTVVETDLSGGWDEALDHVYPYTRRFPEEVAEGGGEHVRPRRSEVDRAFDRAAASRPWA